MQELVEKRTRSSKTHYLGKAPDGRDKYAWDGTIGSLHYKNNPEDEAEQWKEIDSIFEPALAPWDWQMLRAGYHIRVKEDFTVGQIIEFEKQGETVQFQPMALEWTNDLDQIQPIAMPHKVAPVITNPEVDLLPAVGMPSHQGTIKWNNAYGDGIDFEWKCTSTRLVKTLEIGSFDKLPTPEPYILDGGNPVLRLNLIFDPSDVDIYVDGELWNKRAKKQTFNVIEFRKDNEVLWGFMPLRYWGSEPQFDPETGEDANQGQSVATLEKRGNSLYISIRVPYDWLQNAVYPVFIDTTVDEQVSANADDGYVRETSASFYGNEVRSGHYFGGWAHCFSRWTGVSISGTITTSYTEVHGYAHSGTPTLKLWGVDEDNPVAPTNKTEFLADPLTSVGVDWDGAWTDDAWNQSPSLNTIFQELVDSHVISNDAVMLQIRNDNSPTNLYNRGKDYNDDTDLAALLHIEYTAVVRVPRHGFTNFQIPGIV